MIHQDIKTTFENESKIAFIGLLDKGYKYCAVLEKFDDLLGSYLRIEYENREIGRKISIHYFPIAKDRADVLTLYLENGRENCFSASEYLLAQGKAQEVVEKLKIKNYAGSLEERMHKCLAEMRKFLEEMVPLIIEGEQWQHIPSDWAGYR